MKLLFMLVSIIFFSILSQAAEYGKIFASSNLEFVFGDMVKSFYKKYPNDSIHIQYGSSGYLTKRILSGDDYDIFFSADMHYPEMIYDHKMSATKPKQYVRGFLVMVAPKEDFIKVKDITYLTDKKIKKIIITKTKESPYGKVAVEALKNKKIYNKVKQKIVWVEDVGLVVDEVLWHKNIGFISRSALGLFSKDAITYKDIDKTLYSPIEQGYVISKDGIDNHNALDFLKFIFSKDGAEIFKKYGYKPLYLYK